MTAPTVEVTAKLSSFGGPALAGIVITAIADKDDNYDGLIVRKPITATTDTNGDAVFDLFPNALATAALPGLGTTGSTYRFTASVPNGFRLDVKAQVPNQACDLHAIVMSDDADLPTPGEVAGAVRYNIAQTLTDEQKEQVHANIAVLDAAFDATEEYAAGSIGAKLANHIDVTDAPYNARCDSGTTDNTAAFIAAVATGKFVWAPPGVNGAFYKVTAKIPAVEGGGLLGARDGSIIKLVGATTESVIEGNGVNNFTIDGIVLDGESADKTSGSHCLKLTNCDGWRVGWIKAIDAQSRGIGLYQSDNNVFETVLAEDAETSSGLFLFESNGNEIGTVRARNCGGFGVQIFGDSSENQIGSISAEDCGLEALGINYLGKRNRVGTVYSKNSGDNGVSITGVENTVDAVYVDSADFHAVCLYGSRNTVGKVFAKNIGQAVGAYAAVAFTPAFGGAASNNQVGPVLAWDDQGTATMQYAVKASVDSETAWSTGVAVAAGVFRSNASKVYVSTTAGTTGATAPTHSSGTVSDGTVSWTYVGAVSDATGNKVPNVLASGYGTALFLPLAGNEFSAGREFNSHITLRSASDITVERRINLKAGTPETTLVGSPGDLSLRTDQQPGVEAYVKVSGTATNTGWLPITLRRSGNTASRPSGSGSGFQGLEYYDTTLATLGKPTWHSGSTTVWVDAFGDVPGTPTNFSTAVRAVVLTGLSLGTATAIAATDTALVAFGKAQAQITALDTAKANLSGATFTGAVSATSFTGPLTGNVTGNVSGSAGSVAASAITGTTLASNVVTSSLTAVGTIATGVWQGTAIADTYLATISTAGKVANSATTATSAGTANAIVARDASGNFTGNASTASILSIARNINGVSFNGSADITITAAAGTLTGATLAAGVTASSLTSVGTLTALTLGGVAWASRGTATSGLIVRINDYGIAPGMLFVGDGTRFIPDGVQVLARSSVQLVCPADTSEDTMVTITIPADMLGLNGRIRVTLFGTMTNNANAKTIRARFGGSAIYTGQALASNASYKMQFEMANRGSASSQLALGVSGAGGGSWGVSTGGSTTSSIDSTANRDLTLTLQKATSGDTLTIDSYLIEILA